MAKRGTILLFCLVLIILISSAYSGPGFTESTQWEWNLTGVTESSVSLGDVNNDGWLDLALTGYTGSEYIAKIYINNGTSLEENHTWQENLSGVAYSSIAFGDVDNDGHLDLAMTGSNDGSNGLESKIYTNNGSSLQENESWQANLTDAKFWHGAIAWGDVNNDGLLDLAATGTATDGAQGIYINNGTSLVQDTTWISDMNNGGMSLGHMAITFGDLDNDGDLDLVLLGIYSTNFYRQVYINNGTSLVEDNGWETEFGATYGWPALTLGDWDNDGDMDLMCMGTRSGDHLRLFHNNGSSFITNQTSVGDGGTELVGYLDGSIIWGDYDNDGDLDLFATGKEAGRNMFYENIETVLTQDSTARENLATDIIQGSSAWGGYR